MRRNRKGTGTLYKPSRYSRTWWIRFKRGSKGHDITINTHAIDKAQAERVRRRYVSEMERGISLDAYSITLGDLGRLVVNDYELNGYKSIANVIRHFDNHILRILGITTKAMDLSTLQMDAFKKLRLDEKAQRLEINRELHSLRRGFQIAVDKRLLPFVPKFEFFTEPRKRTTYWKEEDIDKLRKAWRNPDTWAVVEFMNWTGWRVNECTTLRWESVEWEQDQIVLREGTTKSGEPRIFPISFIPELHGLLLRQEDKRRQQTSDYVFTRKGNPIRSFSKEWYLVLRQAGLRSSGLKRHDFRSTAIRRLVRVYKVPQDIAQRMVGWSSRDMLDYYNVTEQQDIHDAVKPQRKLTVKRIK